MPWAYRGTITPMYDPRFSLYLQNLPLQQALGPMGQMLQGQQGQFGQAPFVAPPPQPPQYQPQGAWQAMRTSVGLTPQGFPMPAMNPGMQMSGMQYMPGNVGAAGAGALYGLGRMGLSAAGGAFAWQAARGLLPQLPAMGSALWGGVTGAVSGGGLGALGGGVARAGGLAISGMGALPIAGMAGVGLAAAGLGYAAGGIRDYQGVNRVAQQYTQMAGFGGAGGRGVGAQTVGQMTGFMQAQGGQAFKNFEQSMSVFKTLASSGELTAGANNAKDLQRNLEKAFGTVTEIMKAVNTTFDQAGEIFASVKRMGITGKQAMVQYALNARTSAGILGVDTQQVLQLGESGAQMARGMGLYGQGGAAATIGMATSMGAAVRSGAISQEVLREITGGTMNTMDAAQRIAGKTTGFLQNRGQFLVAGLYNQQGEINKDLLDQVTSGRVSIDQLINKGIGNVSSNPALFVNQRQRLTSKLMTESGDQMNALVYQMAQKAAGEAGMGGSQDAIELMIKSFTGAGDAEARAIAATGSPGQQVAMRQLKAAEVEAQQRANVLRERSVGGLMERGIYAPLRGFGAGIREPFSRLSAWMGGVGEGIMSEFSRGYTDQQPLGDMYSRNVRADLLYGARGDFGAQLPGINANAVMGGGSAWVDAYSGRRRTGSLLGDAWASLTGTAFGPSTTALKHLGVADQARFTSNMRAAEGMGDVTGVIGMGGYGRVLDALAGGDVDNQGERGLLGRSKLLGVKDRASDAEIAKATRKLLADQLDTTKALLATSVDQKRQLITQTGLMSADAARNLSPDALNKVMADNQSRIMGSDLAMSNLGTQLGVAASLQAVGGLGLQDYGSPLTMMQNLMSGGVMDNRGGSIAAIAAAMDKRSGFDKFLAGEYLPTAVGGTSAGGFGGAQAAFLQNLASGGSEEFTNAVYGAMPAANDKSSVFSMLQGGGAAFKRQMELFSKTNKGGATEMMDAYNEALKKSQGGDASFNEWLANAGPGGAKIAQVVASFGQVAGQGQWRASDYEQRSFLKGMPDIAMAVLKSGQTMNSLGLTGGDESTKRFGQLLAGERSAQSLAGQGAAGTLGGVYGVGTEALKTMASKVMEGGITSREEEQALAMMGGTREGFGRYMKGLQGLNASLKGGKVEAGSWQEMQIKNLASKSGMKVEDVQKIIEEGKGTAGDLRKIFQGQMFAGEGGNLEQASGAILQGSDQFADAVKQFASVVGGMGKGGGGVDTSRKLGANGENFVMAPQSVSPTSGWSFF